MMHRCPKNIYGKVGGWTVLYVRTEEMLVGSRPGSKKRIRSHIKHRCLQGILMAIKLRDFNENECCVEG
jgi:hypothetical protein